MTEIQKKRVPHLGKKLGRPRNPFKEECRTVICSFPISALRYLEILVERSGLKLKNGKKVSKSKYLVDLVRRTFKATLDHDILLKEPVPGVKEVTPEDIETVSLDDILG